MAADHILLLYSNGSNVGGAQTLMARMANWLTDRGRRVTVVFTNGPIHRNVQHLFGRSVALRTLPSSSVESWSDPGDLQKAIPCLSTVDCIVPFSSDALFAALLFARKQAVAILPYVIYRNQYCDDSLYNENARSVFWRLIPHAAKIFMNERTRDVHAEWAGVALAESSAVPLPLQRPSASVSGRRVTPFRVVSIGRIDPVMKPYNFACVSVIKELREKGIPVTWDIYGGSASPDAEHRLKFAIDEANANDFIKWHGEIPYSRFSSVLETAQVFVGMGTSVLESAAMGVPSIVAIAEESRPITQGYLHNQPIGNCGEYVPTLPELRITELLEDIFTMEEVEYEEMSKTSAAFVSDHFDIDNVMSRIMVVIDSAIPNSPSWTSCVVMRAKIWSLRAGVQLKRFALRMSAERLRRS